MAHQAGDAKPVARHHRVGCGEVFGMSEPGRGAGGNIAEWGKNMLRTPLNFYRRCRVQHTVEVTLVQILARVTSSCLSARWLELERGR